MNQTSYTIVLASASSCRDYSLVCRLDFLFFLLQILLATPYRSFPPNHHRETQSWHPSVLVLDLSELLISWLLKRKSASHLVRRSHQNQFPSSAQNLKPPSELYAVIVYQCHFSLTYTPICFSRLSSFLEVKQAHKCGPFANNSFLPSWLTSSSL